MPKCQHCDRTFTSRGLMNHAAACASKGLVPIAEKAVAIVVNTPRTPSAIEAAWEIIKAYGKLIYFCLPDWNFGSWMFFLLFTLPTMLTIASLTAFYVILPFFTAIYNIVTTIFAIGHFVVGVFAGAHSFTVDL